MQWIETPMDLLNDIDSFKGFIIFYMVSNEQEVESVEEAAGKSGFFDLFDLLFSLLCGLSSTWPGHFFFFFF